MKLPDWLIVWVCQSLIGEIYPEIRAIALRYDSSKNFVYRVYLDRKSTDDDDEAAECVLSNIFAHTSSNNEIVQAFKEVIFSDSPMNKLDPLDGFVYARKE